VEGVTAYDPEMGAMAVFATNVTTRLLQAAQRQAEAALPDTKPAAPRKKPAMPEIPADLPPEAAQHLHNLYVAAEMYREKLAALEARPEHQRAGYEMTRRLLHNTEAQIAGLLQRYT
jgi:hypothetical protein